MNSIEVEFKNQRIKLEHPENFNELTPTQFMQVVRIAYNTEYDEAKQLELCFHLLKESDVKKKFRIYDIIEAAVLHAYADSLLALQKFVNDKIVLDKWLIPFIQTKKTLFLGPLDRFSYMTFGEFIYADMLFMRYMQGNNEALLNSLLAVLYRENDKKALKKTDKRVKFESSENDYRAKQLAEISALQKQAVLINYSGIRSSLEAKYPFVFGGKEQTSNLQVVNLGTSQSGWMTIRRNLAESVLNYDKIDSALLSDVLADFNEKLSKND
ncbi:MAG TPA: hypothetical protein DCQ31_11950 [Bacteroidales bacterium]|nr:hypothetical protein [Bacteroidales bacterium]